MDQEREKLARETAANIRFWLVAHQETIPNQQWFATQIDRALQQWGDLRAEQVRRETVEKACRFMCGICSGEAGPHYTPAIFDLDRWGHRVAGATGLVAVGEWFGRCQADSLRRAFAASQGGTT